ncbi:MAG: outer membrane protein assembly factor BamB [Chitinophagales bacterium]|jgi:outer membrane protein assembly factor BamB
MRKSNYLCLANRTTLLLLLAAFATGCSWSEDEEESFYEPADLVSFDEQMELATKWSRSVGDGQGDKFNRLELALDDDGIYVAEVDGDVYAFEIERGKEQWEAELNVTLTGGVGVGESLVVVGTVKGVLIALDKNTGAKLWTKQLTGEVLAPPAIADEVVIAQTFDGRLYGLDAANGEQLWVYDSVLPRLTLRGTSRPVIDGDTVYAGFASGKLVALDVETGVLQWEARVSPATGQSEIDRVVDVDSPAFILNNTIYAVSYQGRVTAFDLRSGTPKWFQAASSYNALSEGFSNLYYSHSDGDVVALDLKSGIERWRQTEFSFRELGAPTAFSSYVAVADFEGYIHLLSQVDGSVVGREKIGSNGVRAQMLSQSGVLYVYGNSGKLKAYEIEK